MSAVKIWWLFISIAAGMNIALWFYSASRLSKHKDSLDPYVYKWRRALLGLSAIYVAGCAFRSFLPRIDLERICLAGTWLSSMLVGRSVATIAEIAIIVQCSILLREAGKGAGDPLSIFVARLIVPIIIVAECSSWYAVITTDYLGSVIEESLWTVSGILLAISFISLWTKVKGIQKHFLLAMLLFCLGFITFMVTVDVQMYWFRYQQDTVMGAGYLSLTQGIFDSAKACIVRFDWSVWHQEIVWMTLYFTVAVWVSILLAHAPAFVNKNNSES
jgi:hypothetical protein